MKLQLSVSSDQARYRWLIVCRYCPIYYTVHSGWRFYESGTKCL